MKSLAQHMSFYYGYHQKTATKVTHIVGIPLVLFAVFILLGWIHISVPNVFDTSLMWLVIVAALVYYFLLDYILALAMTAVFAILGFFASFFTQAGPTWIGFKIFLYSFIIGWLIQLIGHFIEGKRPALTVNLFQAIIGPIFIVAEIFFMLGYRKDLQEKVERLAGD